VGAEEVAVFGACLDHQLPTFNHQPSILFGLWPLLDDFFLRAFARGPDAVIFENKSFNADKELLVVSSRDLVCKQEQAKGERLCLFWFITTLRIPSNGSITANASEK
jgi:hypothetical protein